VVASLRFDGPRFTAREELRLMPANGGAEGLPAFLISVEQPNSAGLVEGEHGVPIGVLEGLLPFDQRCAVNQVVCPSELCHGSVRSWSDDAIDLPWIAAVAVSIG